MGLKSVKKNEKVISGFVTLLVIGLLIFAGPASASTIELDPFNDDKPYVGDIITTNATLKIDSTEWVNSTELILNDQTFCSFKANETTSCSNGAINVTFLGTVPDTSYMQGYGWSNVSLSYEIKINTSHFSTGTEYKVKISANINGNTENSLESSFTVYSRPTSTGSGGGCITQWDCTEWSECVGGSRTRVCSYPENYCAPRTTKPLEYEVCSVSRDDKINSGDLDISGNDVVPTIDSEETESDSESAISSATIAVAVGKWFLGIIVLLAIIGLIAWIVFRSKRGDIKKKRRK